MGAMSIVLTLVALRYENSGFKDYIEIILVSAHIELLNKSDIL